MADRKTDRDIKKLRRCIEDVEGLDPRKVQYDDQSVRNIASDIAATLTNVFGKDSQEYENNRLLLFPSYLLNMRSDKAQETFPERIAHTIKRLKELIEGLEEKREDREAEQSDVTSSVKPLPKGPFKVFYAWQSNRPNNLCRSLIRKALDEAQKQLDHDPDLQKAVEIDQDTQDTPGSPAVADTILQKIRGCSVFVADLTFIDTEAKQVTPNPNVLLEYGYALHALGAQRIVGVFNEAFGKPADLPFDLRYRRFPIQYRANDDSQDEERREERKKLAKALAQAIKDIVTKSEDRISAPAPASIDREDRVREVSRVANKVAEATIYVDDLSDKLIGGYNALFRQANASGGSATN